MSTLTKKTGLIVGFFATLFSWAAQATEFDVVQTDRSAILFVYKQMNVPVEGNFKRFKGQISFDPAKPALARTEIEIELASIDAGSDEANDEVVGKLWFNTRLFPVARFVSSKVVAVGNNRFEVTGKMSVKGRTLDTKTAATFRQEGGMGVFEGAFMLNRADYGIGEGVWADFGTVANEVEIKFRLVASAAVRKK